MQIFREGPGSEWALPGRSNRSCLVRQKLTMAVKIWSVRLLPAWVTLALETLPSFSKPRLSSRPLSRPKESSFKQFKALEWERADVFDLSTLHALTIHRHDRP